LKKGYADTPNGQIHYRFDGSGPALLLLHKTSMSSNEYSEVLPIFSKTHFTVAMDTPGYGNSDEPAHFSTIEDHSATVLEFFRALGIKKIRIVGHLTGASIAVEVAASHPDLVEKLVLASCPYYHPDVLQERLSLFNFGLEEIREDGSHLLELWRRYRTIMPQAKPENLQRTILGYLLAGPRAHEGHQAVFRYKVENRLPLLKCPTLLLSGGEKDIFHERMEVTKALIPDCRTQVIDGGGDLIPLEKPAEFAEVTLDFLQSLKS
jgi:pimeloyl-ACP methyl ester carboxylesterase